MISNEERREVAARMRDIMRRYPHCFLDNVVAQSVLEVMGDGVKIGKTVADLIDRSTCGNVSGYKDVFVCSECRCKVEAVGEECNEYGEVFSTPLMPRFCPNCGAEVVE